MQQTILKKYAVKTFSDIIGQQYIVSFFQNSLYKNIFYPLYLLAGMRGTGKTTCARLFAAAALCDRLIEFQKNTKIEFPCYTCDSCQAVVAKNHPDIIELDAASHTGVETIRAIIDNAYVLPVLKEKKFYIIDEVHMLSKAAFNACLKIMEEPPAHVHFILATTEIYKVIDTIKSRSIVLNFKPIGCSVLRDHLKKIVCEQGIGIEDDALDAIIKIGENSVRDVCNILEKLYISHKNITLEIIYEEYGYPSALLVEEIIDALLLNDTKAYFEQKKFLIGIQSRKIFFELSIRYVQKKIEEVLTDQKRSFEKKRLFSFLRLLYQYEQFFLTSENPFGLFDLFLEDSSDRDQGISMEMPVPKNTQQEVSLKHQIDNTISVVPVAKPIVSDGALHQKNEQFIVALGSVLSSIFKQGLIVLVEEKKILEVTFKKNFSFYKDFLDSKKDFIEDTIEKVFLNRYGIVYYFKDDGTKKEIDTKPKKEESAVLSRETNERLVQVDSSQYLIDQQDKPEKKTLYTYEKKNKKGINHDHLPPEVRKIASLFSGTTYIKEE